MLYVVGQNQQLLQILQWLGYVLLIANKIAKAPIIHSDSSTNSPPNFVDGMVLNLINPKAYAAMTVIYSQMLLPYSESKRAYAITGLVCLVVVLLWVKASNYFS